MDLGGGILLRVAASYKHLGVWQAPIGRFNREIAGRSFSAAAVCGALGRTCLGNQAIPVPARTMVARACVLSRGLYQAGAWPLLSRRQFGRAAVSYHKPFRTVAGANRPPPPGAQEVSNGEVRSLLSVVPMEWELRFLRLMMLPRVSQSPPFIAALVQGSGGASWRTAVAWSAKAVHLLLADKFAELPCPLQDMSP